MNNNKKDAINLIKKAFIYNLTMKPWRLAKCPSPEKLVLFARMEVPIEERIELIDHIDKCNSCALEFQAVIKIIKKEKEFLAQIKKP